MEFHQNHLLLQNRFLQNKEVLLYLLVFTYSLFYSDLILKECQMTKRYLSTYFAIIVLLLSNYTTIYSQVAPKSMYGKRFYIAYPTIGGNSLGSKDSTYCNFSIFSLSKSTKGVIKTADTTINFSTIFNWSLNTYNTLEYSGLHPGFFNRYHVTVSEEIEKKGIYIEAEDSVMVSMFVNTSSRLYDTTITGVPNEMHFTSEAATAYPIESLSTNYVVITKSEDGAASHFLILATEDSTVIEITPSKTTEKGKLAGIPFTKNLQKGETYLVRSPSADLTGSSIHSVGSICHPIAVFVGSPYTTIGSEPDASIQKENILFEQLPPKEFIGNRYIVPIKINVDETQTKSTIRVLALDQNTRVLVDGQQVGSLLSKGEFIDFITDSVVYISSEEKILVALFTNGTSRQEPSMSILYSLDQMMPSVILAPLKMSVFNYDIHNPASVAATIIARYDDRDSITKGIPGPNWKRVSGNPIYGYYFFKYSRERGMKVENKTGNGLQGMIYNIVLMEGFSYSTTVIASFSRTIYGGIDTTGIFANITYCSKNLSSFEAFADTTSTSFQWEFGDGGKASGKTVGHVYQNAGQYVLKLIIYRDAFCSYDTVRRNITVRASPVVKAGPRASISLCIGATAQLGTGELPGVAYRWSPAIGLSDTTVGQPFVTGILDSVKYFVRAYDNFGCESIDSIVVRMPNPPIANAGPDTVSCGGNGVQIGRATVGGVPDYTFLWIPPAGLSNPAIERPIASPTITTEYILKITDNNFCVDFDTVLVTALPAPAVIAGVGTTICEGDSVQLNASGAPVYKWVNAKSISDTTIQNPFVFPKTTTTYHVAGIFPTGCVGFDSVVVTVTPKPRLPIAFQSSACPQSTKIYTVDDRSDVTYQWNITDGTITNGQGSNEATVTWGNGPTGTINLVVTTTAGLCKFDTTVTITISSSIVPTITESKKNTVVPSKGTVLLCPGESLTLDVGPGYTEINWSNGQNTRQTSVNTGGWYGVTVKDATGCSGGDSVFVTIVPAPTVVIGADRVLCGADTAVLRANVIGSGTYTYQWIPPTAVSDPTAIVTNFIAPTTTSLILAVTDTLSGCITNDTMLMTVLTLGGDFVTTSNGKNIFCFGESLTLDAGAFDSYTWSTGATSRTITINQAGNYWVDAKSGSCSAIDTINITQNPQIIVSAGNDITSSPGATVTLDANATGGTLPYQFQWSPNIGFIDPTTLQSARVQVVVGSQDYIITVTDANGCVVRDTVTVFVPSTATTITAGRIETSASATGVRIPLTLTLTPNTPINPTGLTAVVTIPFEQFIPTGISKGTMVVVQNATQYQITIEVPITTSFSNGAVITEIIGDVLLGQQDSTTVTLTSAAWQGTQYPITTADGRIVLTDVCYSGVTRYLLPTTIGFGILSINPNPAKNTATFELGLLETGNASFELYDIFGQIVHSATWNIPPVSKGGTDAGRITHQVDVSNLPAGTYFSVVRTFSQRETKPFIITK